MRARTRLLTGVSLITLLVGACGSDSGPAPSPDSGAKVGGKPGPIAITVADSQFPNKPSNLPLAEFKREVEQLSGGSMTVTVLTEAVDDFSDAAVIDKVKSGTFQMAVVPARAWSEAGVTSLKALQAPFLFESDEHVAAAVEDPAITKDLFSGLEGSGVTGLALFPESLRHLFSFGEPMLTPADVKGRTLRAISSLETTKIIGALGATAVDPVGDAFQQGIDAGTIQGTDSGFTLAAGSNPTTTAIATGNLTLYAKVMSLVINSAFLAGLDDAQRDIVAKASDATRAWAIANQVTDADAAAKFCKGGGTVVLTEAASIAAFRTAEAPVYAALEADPATKRAIAAIRALAPGTSAASVEACGSPDKALLEPDGGELPNGIYRVVFSDEYLQSWGVGATDNHGVYTFTLNDGQWSAVQRADNITDDSAGIYRAEGHDVYWLWDLQQQPNERPKHHTWSVDDKGTLTFTPVTPDDADFEMALPFVRIADLP